MTTTPDISITLHKVRATIIGNTPLGKFWLYSTYGTDVIRIDDFVGLQIPKDNIHMDIAEMKEDGLEVIIN